MKFAPKELCEKLVKMGCKTDSDHFYSSFDIPSSTNPFPSGCFSSDKLSELCPAFTIEDFVGTHKQAKENAILIAGEQRCWSEEDHCNSSKSLYATIHDKASICCRCFRHDMIDSKDWIKYLEETIK